MAVPEAVRRAIQKRKLAERYNLNPKTIVK